MLFSLCSIALLLAGSANAHFRLLYPAPRGEFVSDKEPDFCGGYTDAGKNRTVFPLEGGFFTIKTSHPDWTGGVLISTKENPTSFDDFKVDGKDQYARYLAKASDAGEICVPLNLAESNVEGVQDGANVTIQVVLGGSDGSLYQCADLTLSKDLARPENSTCTNVTTTHSATTPSQTAENGGAEGAASANFRGIGMALGAVALGGLTTFLL
jgi:hypothetical protein